MVVAILPWYSPYLSSQAHGSYSTRFLCYWNNPTGAGLTSCIMQLLASYSQASLLLLRDTRHYGICLVPIHLHWAYLPKPMRLQVSQHGVQLACTPPTSLVTHSVP